MFLRDGDGFVVTQRELRPAAPAAWPLNLLADPRATVQIGAEICLAAHACSTTPRPTATGRGWSRSGRRTRPISPAAANVTPSCWSLSRRGFVTLTASLSAPARSTLVRECVGHKRDRPRSSGARCCSRWRCLRGAGGRGRAHRRLGLRRAASCMRSCARSKAAARSVIRSTSHTATSWPTLVRRYAPERRLRAQQRRAAGRLPPLPQDRCSDGSDAARAIDRSPRTAGDCLHACGRPPRRGGALYLQYWFYYPESFTGGIGRIFGDSWPGFHRTTGRATRCGSRRRARRRARRRTAATERLERSAGWFRVSGGSHAGQLVDRRADER